MEVLPFFDVADLELVQLLELKPMSMFAYFTLKNAELAQNWSDVGTGDEYWLEKLQILNFAKENPGFLVHRPPTEVGYIVDLSVILDQPSTNADSDYDEDYFDDEDVLYNPGAEYELVKGKYKKTSAFVELNDDPLHFEREYGWAYDKLWK